MLADQPSRTSALNPDPLPRLDHAACLNCDAPLSANFCAQCGQETTLHVPSAREFLHEFISHYVALEGRLWKTLGLLMFKPGKLTAEYIAGRRMRYVQPLRLYLTFSILFFALFKYGHVPVAVFGAEEAKPRPAASVPAPGSAQGHSRLSTLNPAWGAKFEAFNALPDKEKAKVVTNAFFNYVPYAMFCLLPVFALYLKLLYIGSGRRYGEHLLFALHTNAFAFVVFGLITVVPDAWDFVILLLFGWLAFYLPLALRRVYDGRWPGTTARWLALMTLHLLSMGMAILAAFGLAVIA